MDIKQIKRTRTGHSAMFSILLILLTFLTGCVTPKPESRPLNQPADNSPAATEAEDVGRGFVITETAQLEESTRKNFDTAVLLLNEEVYDEAIEILEKVIERSPGVTAPYIDL